MRRYINCLLGLLVADVPVRLRVMRGSSTMRGLGIALVLRDISSSCVADGRRDVLKKYEPIEWVEFIVEVV